MRILEDEEVLIPWSVRDHESFREWARSDEFPEHGRIDYIAGSLEIDMTHGELETHEDPKSEIAAVLRAEARARGLGKVWVDGALLSNVAAGLSCVPDVVLLCWETLESGRAKLVSQSKRRPKKLMEIEGTVDLVVEIVSDSSAAKDKERLRERYHVAGVREYWLVDARGEELLFTILRHRPDGYVASPARSDGFARSEALGREARLTRQPARMGLHDTVLELRASPGGRRREVKRRRS